MADSFQGASSHKNFLAGSLGEYMREYVKGLNAAMESVDVVALQKVEALLRMARSGGNCVYVAGNGGSAAISEHLCCDWTKGTSGSQRPDHYLKTHSLVSNVALLTALGNDVSFERVFSEQVQMVGAEGDVLVLISSSGNSPNIIKAAEIAREKKMKVVSFSGFTGGKIVELSDINVFVKFSNYGIVEDCHQSLMHILSQFLTVQK